MAEVLLWPFKLAVIVAEPVAEGVTVTWKLAEDWPEDTETLDGIAAEGLLLTNAISVELAAPVFRETVHVLVFCATAEHPSPVI